MGDFTQLTPTLWMGGIQLPAMPAGFDAIVSCKEIEDFELLPTVKAFLWVPMIDGPIIPEAATIRAALSFVSVNTCAGRKTLVHCAEGHNRSGLVIASYLINEGWAQQHAIDFIRENRPGALSNQAFVDYLLSS